MRASGPENIEMTEPSSPAPAAPNPPQAAVGDGPQVPATTGVWDRAKEHKVLQWGLAYLGAGLALAHGAELLGHTFHWPETAQRLIMAVLIVGLPLALTLAWYHG